MEQLRIEIDGKTSLLRMQQEAAAVTKSYIDKRQARLKELQAQEDKLGHTRLLDIYEEATGKKERMKSLYDLVTHHFINVLDSETRYKVTVKKGIKYVNVGHPSRWKSGEWADVLKIDVTGKIFINDCNVKKYVGQVKYILRDITIALDHWGQPVFRA